MIADLRLKGLAITVGALLVAMLALAAAACGGSDGDDSSQTSGSDANASTAAAGDDTADMVGSDSDDDMADMMGTDSGDDSGSPPDSIEITAKDNVFDVQPSQGTAGTIEAPANTEFTVRLVNDGVLPHNIAFYTEEGGTLLDESANGDIILEGESDSITFTTPDPGTYFFVCTVHPQEMIGDFIVK